MGRFFKSAEIKFLFSSDMVLSRIEITFFAEVYCDTVFLIFDENQNEKHHEKHQCL